MAGKLIVIEGLDGSGKATQTELLLKTLQKENQAVKKLSFPNYSNPSSSLVKMYLDGTLGDKPDDVNAYAASSFYAVDRVASYLQFWKNDYENGSIFLADRYATSNAIYQMAKIDTENWLEFINWLDDFEYTKLKIPKPDLVIYLDVPPEISQELMSKRYAGDESKKDLHEKNVKYLLDCRTSALYAAQVLNWQIINCAENGKIRSIDSISKEIEQTIRRYL